LLEISCCCCVALPSLIPPFALPTRTLEAASLHYNTRLPRISSSVLSLDPLLVQFDGLLSASAAETILSASLPPSPPSPALLARSSLPELEELARTCEALTGAALASLRVSPPRRREGGGNDENCTGTGSESERIAGGLSMVVYLGGGGGGGGGGSRAEERESGRASTEAAAPKRGRALLLDPELDRESPGFPEEGREQWTLELSFRGV